MDLEPPLLPIVIPPLEVNLPAGKFTCSGNGLVKMDHTFDPDVKKHLPLLEPARTKKGTVRVNQPCIKKQLLTYWKAQCVFRGLSQSGTVQSLQDQLRRSDAGMTANLAKIEKKLNKEFREKNAAVRDEKWNSIESNEKKAEMDPRRFLQEFFYLDGVEDSSHDEDAVVLKTHFRSELHQAAESLGLEHNSADAPAHADGTRPSIDRWIIISKTRSAFSKQVQAISREKVRIDRILEDESNERNKKLNETMVAKAKESGKATWDVTGKWNIKCPEIESNWGKANRALTLVIYITNTGEGRQMWADFDFTVIQGIFRFIKPTSTGRVKNASLGPATAGSKRKRIDVEEDDGYSKREKFILSADDEPDPKCPEWDFRWRGEETGEGMIQLSSENYRCSIKFEGLGGCKLTGTFEADFTGRVEFTGLKIGKWASGSRDPGFEWNKRNQSAYEAARINRWR